MIWASHRIVTGISVFTLSSSMIGALAAVSGSTFPDSLDMTFPLKHRGVSHWFAVYVVPLILDFYFIMDRYFFLHFSDYMNLFQVFPFELACKYLLGNLFFWFMIGCLCHIIEDSLTGYIPIRSPHDKVSLWHPFYTGSPTENVFVLVFSLFCLALVFFRYWLTGYFQF